MLPMIDFRTFIGIVGALSVLAGCAAPRSPSPFAAAAAGPVLLAHRGVAQTFDAAGLTDSTCTATHIHPPRHALLENTLASIAAAIKAGAAVVEVDVHPTTDGEFAVFHDWTLECRTNGTGRTRDRDLAYLKSLDIGHGYTADGGRTFPFRGQGLGLMPSLAEVLKAFPGQPLLINVKSNDPSEGRLLAEYLGRLKPQQRQVLAVYGGDRPVAELRKRVGDVVTMSRASLKSCLISYLLIGWSGALPDACGRTLVLIPINYTGWIWGWPHRFVERMQSVGSAVFVAGDYSGGPSQGIDTVDDLRRLPADYRGGIWTNEIERIGAALARGQYGPRP